jgi:hypothetical protein
MMELWLCSFLIHGDFLEFILCPNVGVGKATTVAHSKCLLKMLQVGWFAGGPI